MPLHRYITPLATSIVVSTALYVAYRTHEMWMPHVFPTKTAEKPSGGHDDHAGHEGHDHGHDHGPQGDRVKLSPQAQQNLALDVDTLTPQAYYRTMLIPGIVVDRPGESDRSVTSKVSGVVAEIRAKPGDTVKGGDPLFKLNLVSEFLQSVQTDIAKAARELEFATAKRDRTADLVKKGTVSGVVLIEDENMVKRVTTQVQAYRRQLQVFGLSPDQVNKVEKGQVETEIVVVAPGQEKDLYEVQELKVNLGDQVQAGQVLCYLANHQRLFVEGRAFKSEADALAIAAQNKVPIKAEFADEKPGTWKAQEPLTIHHLANQVDPGTRTFAFYLALDNQPRTYELDKKLHFVWRYRPGQRVSLRVPIDELVTYARDGKTKLQPFVLPAGAVVREGAEAYVFVQNGNVFIRKPVRVLYGDRSDAVIANDGSVTDAEFVVKNQAAAINRSLKAAAAGGATDPHAGHNH